MNTGAKHLAAAILAFSATVLMPAPAQANTQDGLIQPVQYYRYYHRPYYRHGYYGPYNRGYYGYGPRFYHRGYYRHFYGRRY